MDRDKITVTTVAATGVGSNTTKLLTGLLSCIVYTKHASPFADGVVFTVVGASTGLPIWSQTISDNESTVIFPRAKSHDVLGAELKYATSGTNVCAQIPLINEAVQISVASGGSTPLSGTFEVIVA